jgi:hypothetical protein
MGNGSGKGKALDTLYGGGGSDSVGGKVFIGPNRKATVNVPGINIDVEQEVDTTTIVEAKKRYFRDSKIQSGWLVTLKKNGYGDVSPRQAQALYELSVDGAGEFYQKSGGVQKITPEKYLQWYSKDTGISGSGGPKVSVQKYLFQPEEIQSIIDDTLKSTLNRKATDDETKQFYTAIQDMINQGTVTTTKKVGGKTITETTPGYSKEKAQAVITSKLKEQSPQDFQEKASLDFGDFLRKLGG